MASWPCRSQSPLERDRAGGELEAQKHKAQNKVPCLGLRAVLPLKKRKGLYWEGHPENFWGPGCILRLDLVGSYIYNNLLSSIFRYIQFSVGVLYFTIKN